MKINRSGSRKKAQASSPGISSQLLLDQASSILRKGGIVAFPTDTFYGLGAAMDQDLAIDRIYKVKGRDPSKPLLVVVADLDMALSICGPVSSEAMKLIETYWPGPLTLLLPARDGLRSRVISEDRILGVRWPNAPMAQELVRCCGVPLTATSANRSGSSNPVTADQVEESLGGELDMILDLGPTTGGRESTIVNATLKPPRLVREGEIPFDRVMGTLGMTLTDRHDW